MTLILTALHVLFLFAPQALHERTIRSHLRLEEELRTGCLVFVGDNPVAGLFVDTGKAHPVNFGIGGDTTDSMLVRMKRYHSLDRASCIVLCVGVNDLVLGAQDDAILKNFRAILDVCPPNVPVIVCGLTPVNTNRARITNTRIARLNESLAKLVDGNRDQAFVSTTDAVSDAAGRLRHDFDFGDGVHLNAKGWEAWGVAVRQAIPRR